VPDPAVAIRRALSYPEAIGDPFDHPDRDAVGTGHLVRRIESIGLGDLLLAFHRNARQIEPGGLGWHARWRPAFNAGRGEHAADDGL
jgi:hypothetical protein